MKRLRAALTVLLLLALPVTAAAQGSSALRTGYREGDATTSRTARGCKVAPASAGTLTVDCRSGGEATIAYSIDLAGKPRGSVQASVDALGDRSKLRKSVSVRSSQKVLVTVTIKGKARVQLRSVSISYYA
jgi:hypothetical protein